MFALEMPINLLDEWFLQNLFVEVLRSFGTASVAQLLAIGEIINKKKFSSFERRKQFYE